MEFGNTGCQSFLVSVKKFEQVLILPILAVMQQR